MKPKTGEQRRRFYARLRSKSATFYNVLEGAWYDAVSAANGARQSHIERLMDSQIHRIAG